MSFCHDKQIKAYWMFLALFAFLSLGTGLMVSVGQTHAVKGMYLSHDEAVASSLLEQGVSKEVIAAALTNTNTSENGKELLAAIGLGDQTVTDLLPFLLRFQRTSVYTIACFIVCFIFVLFAGTFVFFWRRERLYLQAEKVISRYLDGDYSCHLPQNREGAVFQLFSSIEQLATMLQSQKETESDIKLFLKNTISDLSHQLKTPLAALVMYQEIMEKEPDNVETVKKFSTKAGITLKRMEQLIQSILALTRMDTGNIVFKKNACSMADLIARAIEELTVRANAEEKEILIDGEPGQMLVCDMEWTSEAIGNLVKNALDHTKPGGVIHITWEQTPAMLRIIVSDDGEGIAPEDIHHIFKRFYRSRHGTDAQGIGLGLSLAKSIVEGQGGFISVQSNWKEGTAFTLSFLTEP